MKSKRIKVGEGRPIPCKVSWTSISEVLEFAEEYVGAYMADVGQGRLNKDLSERLRGMAMRQILRFGSVPETQVASFIEMWMLFRPSDYPAITFDNPGRQAPKRRRS